MIVFKFFIKVIFRPSYWGLEMAAFVRRAPFGAITSIRHALGGVISVRAQCHRCFAKQKKTARLFGAVRWCVFTFNHRLSRVTHGARPRQVRANSYHSGTGITSMITFCFTQV